MTKENMYVDVHVLQTIPSSNINRDDTGAPKTAVYGGVLRSRVSSQSWKRAMRLKFKDESKDADWLNSYRTKRGVHLLADELQKLDSDLDKDAALKKAVEVFKAAGIKATKDKKTGIYTTGALLLISKGQIEKIAKYAIENENLDKKQLKKILMSDQSLDLALFGRMVADDPSLNVDASCQVAHAISTHEITQEFDFYTALDDLQDDDNAGSAMMGTIDYNSSTLYRYANINVNELVHNLGSELAVKGIGLFINDFITSMPNGKQNSFANTTLPQYIMVEIRKDTPVNLVSAFEKPIASRHGYVEESIKRLETENKKVQKIVDNPVFTIALTTEKSSLSKQADNLKDLVNKVSGFISGEMNNEDIND